MLGWSTVAPAQIEDAREEIGFTKATGPVGILQPQLVEQVAARHLGNRILLHVLSIARQPYLARCAGQSQLAGRGTSGAWQLAREKSLATEHSVIP